MQLQVDQHVEYLELRCRGQEEFIMSRRLRKTALRPKRLSLDADDTDGSSSAMTALLTTEQHYHLFERVQSLEIRVSLSKEMLQVRTQ
jgi:hypothetical protein